MPSKDVKIAVDLAAGVVRQWEETYEWIPIFGAFAVAAMAFFSGANNLPSPFLTAVGSGALTLLKAAMVACFICAPGVVFASNTTVNALLSGFLKEIQPTETFLMWSLVVVLVTAATWFALATYFELPVSCQQSTQVRMRILSPETVPPWKLRLLGKQLKTPPKFHQLAALSNAN